MKLISLLPFEILNKQVNTSINGGRKKDSKKKDVPSQKDDIKVPWK